MGAMMYRGINTLALDSKGRLAIPARYRDDITQQCQGKLILTVDRDHCLLLYPLPEWEEIERKLVRLPSFNAQSRRLQRLLIGHATECEADGNGRILLPQPLREFASIDKSAVMIGQGNKFEIWAESTWHERRAEWLTQELDTKEEDMPDELGRLSL